MSQPPPTVLSFAAGDSTGGAGIQADILTLASMGCHPLSVITAITIQDTAGVDDVMALDPEWVADQARAVLEDMPVHVFKIGLLGSVEIIAAIAEGIKLFMDMADSLRMMRPAMDSETIAAGSVHRNRLDLMDEETAEAALLRGH